ncbi:MAG: methylmalonyl-CoA epimerase [Candidatus Rokuibacteriota bacterium]
MVTNIHHVGIAVESLTKAYDFWRDTLGLPLAREATVKEQGVRAALLAAGDSEIELLEPLGPETPIGRFLARRGEGLHHVCFKTADVDGDLTVLQGKRVALLDTAPRNGLAGRVAFLHPKACHGVLVELATPETGETHAESPVRFKRLVIASSAPHDTARTYQNLFGLPEVEVNGGPRTMLGWAGGGTLLMVSASEVGGLEGMVALSMVAPDLPPLVERLEKAQAALLLGAGELTVEPRSSHGVHLHISRYHFP